MCLCGPTGSNCYKGEDGGRWFAAKAGWTLEHFPVHPETVYISRDVQLTRVAENAALKVILDDDAKLSNEENSRLSLG